MRLCAEFGFASLSRLIGRMRIRRQRLTRKFQRRDGLLACHGGKRIQEIIYRVTCFKEIEEILDRDTCANEDRYATLNVGIAVNYGMLHTTVPQDDRQAK